MTGIRFAAQVSRQLWDMYLPLQSLIEMAIPVYPAPVKDELATSMAQHWSAFMAYARSTLQSMEILVLTFAASASLTALTNLGGIALLLLVRRQIRSNISNFGAHSAFQVPTLGADASQREKSASHGVRNTGSHSAGGDSAFSQDPVFLSTRSGAGGGIILSLIPATPRVAQEEPTPRCSEEPSSRKSSMQMSALASDAGSSQGKKTKAPSRAQIRRLAGQEAGGVAAAQAKNLQQLQRAEADLFIARPRCILSSLSTLAPGYLCRPAVQTRPRRSRLSACPAGCTPSYLRRARSPGRKSKLLFSPVLGSLPVSTPSLSPRTFTFRGQTSLPLRSIFRPQPAPPIRPQ